MPRLDIELDPLISISNRENAQQIMATGQPDLGHSLTGVLFSDDPKLWQVDI